METDKKLKGELVEQLSDFYESMPVYPIRKLSHAEIEENAKFYALQFFMGKESLASFKSIQKRDDSTLINLPWDTKIRFYHNSNAIIIRRQMNPLENLIKGKFDINQQAEIAIDIMKKLKLDKWKLDFEQIEIESLIQIEASGINLQEKRAPITLCRFIGTFRRYINKIPVYGRASIYVKVAGGNIIESIGIDWRQIEEKPIDNPKIIKPEIAAEKILKNFNSNLPNKIITSEDFKPQFFTLGYFSLPKRQKQSYMQPVYVAMFKDLGPNTLNHIIVIPATNAGYESIEIPIEKPYI